MSAETLVLIADAARARLFATRRQAPWQLLQSFDHPGGAARASELVSDRPGRVQQSVADGRRSAADPKHSAHEVEAEAFARGLADALDATVAARHPRALVLVAPPRFLGHLRAVISKPVRALVGASLDQDLTTLPEHELPSRLAEIV
ncbi:MAG: host attachment protein [Candidatus Binatia bacterium]